MEEDDEFVSDTSLLPLSGKNGEWGSSFRNRSVSNSSNEPTPHLLRSDAITLLLLEFGPSYSKEHLSFVDRELFCDCCSAPAHISYQH